MTIEKSLPNMVMVCVDGVGKWGHLWTILSSV